MRNMCRSLLVSILSGSMLLAAFLAAFLFGFHFSFENSVLATMVLDSLLIVINVGIIVSDGKSAKQGKVRNKDKKSIDKKDKM